MIGPVRVLKGSENGMGRVQEWYGKGLGMVREWYRVRDSNCRGKVTQDPA